MTKKSLKNLMSLKGRRALVTGANGNLGIEIACTLAESGADLLLLDLPNSDYTELKEAIFKTNESISVETIDCDLEDESSRSIVIETLLQESQKLNIIVNNAAFVGSTDLEGWSDDFENQSLESWRRAIEVNLTSVFHFSKELSIKLKENDCSSIINIGSIYGVIAPDYSIYDKTSMGNPSAYAVSKAGLIHLTKWLSTTLAPNVRVNSISPGGVFNENLPESFIEAYRKKTPMNRMASSEDIKGAIIFLASDLSGYITGQNIMVDGGWTTW